MSTSSSPRLRWGIAGTGAISWTVVADLAATGADITAVYSRDFHNALSFAEAFAIAASVDDFAAFVERADVDVIYLATPFALHFEMAQAALRAGKHVLVEKPMAMNRAEVDALFHLAEKQGLFLMEAMWMKFNPAFISLTALIADGVIGDVRSVRAGFGFRFPQDGGSKWDIKRSGGALRDQGIYPVTLAIEMLGEPVSVYSRGVTRDDGLDLTQHAKLEFAAGRFADCASSIVEFIDPSATINGTDGWIHLPAPFWTMTSYHVHAGDLQRMFVTPDSHDFPHRGNGYAPMLAAVDAAINDGLLQSPVHSAEATSRVFATLDTIANEIESASSIARSSPA